MAVNRQYFGGSSAGGDANTSMTTGGDIHYTFTRPTARKAPDGRRLLIVKAVWAKVAGKTAARSIKARVSYADGAPYDDSSPISVAATTSARGPYRFGVDLPLSSSVGSDAMRVRLIGSGAFYFGRNSTAAGTVVSAAGTTWKGAPAGWIEYAEVASAPRSLRATRDAARADKVVFSWTRESDDGGGSRMGYRLQVAEDPGFTVGLRDFYVAGETVTEYGFTGSKDWYVRVATRNEVSEHFKLPGGTWSGTVIVAATGAGGGGTPDDQGGSSGSGSTGAPNDHLGAPSFSHAVTLHPAGLSVTQGLVRVPATGEWYMSQVHVEADGKQSTRIGHFKADGTLLGSMLLTNAGHGTMLAVQRVSGVDYLWLSWAWNAASTSETKDIVRLQFKPGTYSRTTAPGITTKIAGGGVYRLIHFDSRNNLAVVRTAVGGGKYRYEQHKLASILAGDLSSPLHTIGPLVENPNPTMQGFTTYKNAFFRYLGYPADPTEHTTDPWLLEEWDWTTGKVLRSVDTSPLTRLADGSYPGNKAEPEAATVYDAGDGSSPVLYLGVTTGQPGAHAWEVYSAPLTAVVTIPTPTPTPTPAPAPAPTPANPTPTDPADPPPLTVLDTPEPPPPPPSAKGGLLLSSGSPREGKYEAFLYDRGGRRRIGQLHGLTWVEWNRIRDDQSHVTVKLDGPGADRSEAYLDQLRAGRHELVLFRAGERIWEGPVGLPRFYRERVEIDATDVSWWASRTTIHGRYSNAGTKSTFAVDRIASIFLGELVRKERLDPPVNVLPHLHVYVQDGDARTTRVNNPYEVSLWEHLDDMAAKTGIDYTVVGRAIHIWDTSRAALGRIRPMTEQDFTGDVYIAEYGSELATVSHVTDGQGNWASAGGIDPFYGEIELTATAFGESGNPVIDDNGDAVSQVSSAELLSQAERNLKGRNPAPMALHVPETSSLLLGEDLGLDVLVPGVYVPVRVKMRGRTMRQMQKLHEVKTTWDASGEQIQVTLYPATDDDLADAGVE